MQKEKPEHIPASSPVERVPREQEAENSDSDEDLNPSDFANFRNSVDLSSGKIDRLLCDLRNEIPFANFRDALKTMLFIVRNIIKQPDEIKFRELRSSNPKLKEQIFQYQKFVEVLMTLGFTQRDDYYKMGPPELPLLERAALLMHRHYQRPQNPVSALQQMFGDVARQQGTAENIESTGPVERNMVIFDESLGIPQNPQLVDNENTDYVDGDTELLSAVAKDLRRRSKFSQLLVPQSFVRQHKEASSSYVRPYFTRIRVRIQHHILVQAQFSVHETLSDVANVIRTVLKDPQKKLRFVIPPAAILDDSALDKTLLDLKLLPSAVIYAEFDDKLPLNELMTEEALRSARKLEFEQVQNLPESTSTSSPEQVSLKPKRSVNNSSGKIPAWFKK